jgi:hypothetical protein
VSLPHEAEAPLEEEYPKTQGTIFIQKPKEYQEIIVKHHIYIYIKEKKRKKETTQHHDETHYSNIQTNHKKY